MNKKRIALITTYFPPQKSVATNRMLAFAEYLREDFDVEVFCLGNKDQFFSQFPDVKVHYSPENWIMRVLKEKEGENKWLHKLKTLCRVVFLKIIGNALKSWRMTTLEKVKISHSANEFSLIISSYAPVDAHLVALEFKKANRHIPWITDMRDEMSKNPFISTALKSEYRSIEKQIDAYASALITVSEPILNDFSWLCPSIPYFQEVRNGFNHDFVTVENEMDKVFRFGYFGTFYGAQKPNYFFEALQNCLSLEGVPEIEIHLYGVHQNFEIPLLLKDKVKIFPNLPYKEAIGAMGKMSANFLLLPKNSRRGVYSGKLFDYISVQKPVFACVDKTDVAADLVDKFGAGYVADFQDVQEIQNEMEKLFFDFNQGIKRAASTENVATLHRKNQVKKLIVLIHKILAE